MLPATSLFSLLALAALGAPPLRAQIQSRCPDQGTSFVPAAEADIPPWHTCGLQLHLLGTVIAIGAGRCPTGRTRVDAHEQCLGALAPGMACQDAGLVPVELERCRCVPRASHGASDSTCARHPIGTMGFVTSGQTLEGY